MIRFDPAVSHADRPSGGRRDARIVRHQQHGLTVFCHQPVEQFNHALGVHGIEGAGGFVRQDDRRFGDQRPSDRATLLLAS